MCLINVGSFLRIYRVYPRSKQMCICSETSSFLNLLTFEWKAQAISQDGVGLCGSVQHQNQRYMTDYHHWTDDLAETLISQELCGMYYFYIQALNVTSCCPCSSFVLLICFHVTRTKICKPCTWLIKWYNTDHYCNSQKVMLLHICFSVSADSGIYNNRLCVLRINPAPGGWMRCVCAWVMDVNRWSFSVCICTCCAYTLQRIFIWKYDLI